LTNLHNHYMRLAIKAAENARGLCNPNPHVGAVLVNGDTLVATGWTQCYGSDHAEVQAINKAGNLAYEADLYVTLEPCSHYGKTPPCALAIIKAGIKRVYIGITDPNPLVSGKGIHMLQDAGIEVFPGILGRQIKLQLEHYLCYITQQRPFVTLKTALTLDGKFAAPDGSSRWISNEQARQYVHLLRYQHDAVLTGIQTILRDDPLLNVRLPEVSKQTLRVVIDPLLQTPTTSKLALSMKDNPALIICGEQQTTTQAAKELQSLGARITCLPLNNGHFEPNAILKALYNLNISSVLLETGSGMAESFLKAHLVDKCLFFYGAKIMGGTASPYPGLGITNINDAIPCHNISYRRLGDNIMITAYPKF